MKKWLKKVRRWIAPKPLIPIDTGKTTLEQAAIELVLRARQGDQNAIGTIVAVRENAERGNPTSQQALSCIEKYAKSHPVREYVTFGEEKLREDRADVLGNAASQGLQNDYVSTVKGQIPSLARCCLPKAVTLLADGPTLLRNDAAKPLIIEIAETLTPEQRKAFSAGVKHARRAAPLMRGLPPDCKDALILGVVIGMARKVQAIRVDSAPIRILCPYVAWELGE